jgi:uncharacterized membrane protein
MKKHILIIAALWIAFGFGSRYGRQMERIDIVHAAIAETRAINSGAPASHKFDKFFETLDRERNAK